VLVGVDFELRPGQMSLGPSEELRFYGNLLKNNLFGKKWDLYKIPGPPGYYLAGEKQSSSQLLDNAGNAYANWACHAWHAFRLQLHYTMIATHT